MLESMNDGIYRFKMLQGNDSVRIIPLHDHFQVIFNGYKTWVVPSPDTKEMQFENWNTVVFAEPHEKLVLAKYLGHIANGNRFAVDIGMRDGLLYSITLGLFHQGWQGLALECDSGAFSTLAHVFMSLPEVSLSRCKVTPDNVCALLAAYDTPRDFDFLSLDIDGYDYFVLERILEKYRPSLICTEVHDGIPPPLKFAVRYSPDFMWSGNFFYGQSIALVAELAQRFDYHLMEMYGVNVFLMPAEVACQRAMSPEEAYRREYIEHPSLNGRRELNEPLEPLQHLSPEEGVQFLESYFAQYAGKFVCRL